MNRSESKDVSDPLSNLGGSVARIVQRTERSLTPWVQRALQRVTSNEDRDSSRPVGAAGAMAQRSMAVFERVQRAANRSTVWKNRAELISAPSHATDNFASAVVQRFPETASKYERQPTGGGAERRSVPATAADAPVANLQPMESPDVPGSEAIGSGIAAETFQDIRERIQRAQRGEGGPALPVQRLNAMPPVPMTDPEPFRERYADNVRPPPSFPPSFSSTPSEQVSRTPQPERMRIRRFTHIEEVAGSNVGRSSTSGPEPSRETGLPEPANRNAEGGTERPVRAPHETGHERHVQRSPQERDDTASRQRKPSGEASFRPLPKPAGPAPAEPIVQREQTEPRMPASDMPAMPRAKITQNTTEPVQRDVDESMPLVSAARREFAAAPGESTSSESQTGSPALADDTQIASAPSTPRIQRTESGSTPAATTPPSAADRTNAPMPVARPALSGTPARIQREDVDDLDESGEDETQDDAPDSVDKLETASDDSTDAVGGSADTASEESESESNGDDTDFPLRRSAIQRTPAESVRPETTDTSSVDAPKTPSIQRTVDPKAASVASGASQSPAVQETAPANKPWPSASGIQRAPTEIPDTGSSRAPVSFAPNSREKPPALPPGRVEPRASLPSQPSVQRSIDPAPSLEPAASTPRPEVINRTPSAETSNLSLDDSPTVRRAVEPTKRADTRPEVPPVGRTEGAAVLSTSPTPGTTVASIQRQIAQAMPLRSVSAPSASESAAPVESAPTGELPSIQRQMDEDAADAAAPPNVIRGDARDSSTSAVTSTANNLSNPAGPVSVRRQIDQAMPLRTPAREVSSESAASESPVTSDAPGAVVPMIQRSADETHGGAGTASSSSETKNQPSSAEFRKLPPATASVQRSTADVPASERGPASSEPVGTIPPGGTPAPRIGRDEPATVQRSVTNDMPMRARPHAERPTADNSGTAVEPSLPATSGADDVIRRQATLPDTDGVSGPTSSGPVSSPPLARITPVRPAIQRSIDTDMTPPTLPGFAPVRPAGTGNPGPLAPRAFATPLASPAFQQQAQPYEPRYDASVHASAQSDESEARYSLPSASGVNAPTIQRMPASDHGDPRDVPAMPLVHPFGRVAPQTQPGVQREFQAGIATGPVVSFGAAAKPLVDGSAQASPADMMTLRRMPSIASSAVIQRAPQTVTYVSPLASGDGTIQRADAKPGSVITPTAKKKEEKKGDKKDDKKDEEKAEPPDLDTLAKQILPLLKRMLVVERERHIRR